MKVWAWLLTVVLLGGALSAFLLGKRTAPPRPEVDLALFFTCDTRGRLVPCGCFTGQHGGMTRLKTRLDAENISDALRLDVGDAVEGPVDYQYIEYRYILQAFELMHYDALNLGQREAQLSLQQLRELKTINAPLISANVLDKATGETVFPAYKIVERKGRKIAILGVVDPKNMTEPTGDGVVIESMETALSRWLSKLRAEADMVVVLAFTDEATLNHLARDYYEIDVLLGGKVTQPAQQLVKENRSLIYFTANQSRTLGYLQVKIAVNPRVSALTNEIALLYADIPEDRDVIGLANSYRQEIRKTLLAVDQPGKRDENTIPGIKQTATYVGSESCASCHSSAAKAWHDSRHSHAFGTLIDARADADPKCITCHTVGFGTASGYRREYVGKKLTDVGCESCHGPGSLHAEQRALGLTATFKFRPLGAGDCIQCHQGEFSRPFDWDKFWPAIKHGKEPGIKTVAGGKP